MSHNAEGVKGLQARVDKTCQDVKNNSGTYTRLRVYVTT